MAQAEVDSDVCAKTAVPLPDIRWSRRSSTLASIATNTPRVIQHDGATAVIPSVSQHKQFLGQPLLAYSVHDVTKVLARSLIVTRNKKGDITRREEMENCSIVLPKDNDVWFSVTEHDAAILKFESIDEIPLSAVTSFLVTTAIKGKKPKQENSQQFTKVDIPPGTVLKVERWTSGKRANSICQYVPVGKFRKKVLKYLQCFDEKQGVVFVKLKQKGRFYATGVDGNTDPSHCVMQVKEMLRILSFPVDVTYRFGKIPRTVLFTRNWQLLDTVRENVIIAATIKNYRNVMLELPKDNCPMTFKVAYKDSQLTTSVAYVRALGMCSERCTAYLNEMKPLSEAFVKQRSQSFPSEDSGQERQHDIVQRAISADVGSTSSTNDGYFKMDGLRHEGLPSIGADRVFDQSAPIPCPKRPAKLRCPENPAPVPCSKNITGAVAMNERVDEYFNGLDSEDIYTKRHNSNELTRRKVSRSMTFSVSKPWLSVDSGMGDLQRCSGWSQVCEGELSMEQRETPTENADDVYDNNDYMVMSMEADDILPLGATYEDAYSNSCSSGDTVVSYENMLKYRARNEVERKSVEDIAEHLLLCGVDGEVVEQFQLNRVDGKLLLRMSRKSIRETCPNIREIDVNRLSLIACEGWAPIMEFGACDTQL